MLCSWTKRSAFLKKVQTAQYPASVYQPVLEGLHLHCSGEGRVCLCRLSTEERGSCKRQNCGWHRAQTILQVSVGSQDELQLLLIFTFFYIQVSFNKTWRFLICCKCLYVSSNENTRGNKRKCVSAELNLRLLTNDKNKPVKNKATSQSDAVG